MILDQLLAHAHTIVEAVLLLLVIGTWLAFIGTNRRTRRQLEEAEQKIAALKKIQAEIAEDIESRQESLKAAISERIRSLNAKNNELAKNLSHIREGSEAMMEEMEARIERLKSSLDDKLAKAGAAQDTMRKILQESEKELRNMTNHIDTFAGEISKMKDFIRERTIDLEL
jgi:peptidoglycan hydrolase CwlO-like protein